MVSPGGGRGQRAGVGASGRPGHVGRTGGLQTSGGAGPDSVLVCRHTGLQAVSVNGPMTVIMWDECDAWR